MRLHKRLLAAAPNGLALLAALGIVAGSLGLGTPRPNAGGAYPCEGHSCGCASAEACWLGCCCLTPAERLAWAEDNDVAPPAEFLAALEIAEEARQADPPEESSAASCCQTETKSCCHETAASCCARHAKPPADAEADQAENEQPRVCPGRCHGPGQWWIAGGQPLALPLKPVSLRRAAGETTLSLFETRYQADPDSPPTRPG